MGPTIDELTVADVPATWAALGFEVEGDTYVVSNLYQQWMLDLPKSVKVENQLDAVYRE